MPTTKVVPCGSVPNTIAAVGGVTAAFNNDTSDTVWSASPARSYANVVAAFSDNESNKVGHCPKSLGSVDKTDISSATVME